MSWDLFVMRLPKGLKHLDDTPAGFEPKPLGTRKQVERKLTSLVKGGLKFEDGSATIRHPAGGVIQVLIGDESPVVSVMLTVRGGEIVLPMVDAIVKALGGAALDVGSETGLYTPGNAKKSLAASERYSEKVRGTSKKAVSKAGSGSAVKPVKKAARPTTKKKARPPETPRRSRSGKRGSHD